MANAPDTPAAPAPTLWNSLVKPAVVLAVSYTHLTLPTKLEV